MPTVEGHHDFGVLEERLAALIREAQAGDPRGPFTPVAVVVPSAALRDHVQVCLAERLGSVLAVRVLDHQTFAKEAAASAGKELPAILSQRALEAILRATVGEFGGSLSDFARKRPGVLSSLLRTMGDLREAGIDPARASGVRAVSGRRRDLLAVYAAYSARVEALNGKDRSDRAGALRASLPSVPEFAARFRLVVHYGAYELIGANQRLMQAVADAGTPLVYLVPWHPSSPAYAYASAFPRDIIGGSPPALAGGPSNRLLGDRLPFLHDESAALPPLPRGSIEFFHAQGAAAEIREIARRALALASEGIPFARIGVVARSLEPYAPILRAIFDEHRIPFSSNAKLGALRRPHALAALNLARAALGGWERQPLMDLFRCGLWKPRDLGNDAHGWERLSRKMNVARGYRAWGVELPRWLGEWEALLPDDADATARDRAREEERATRGLAPGLKGALETLKEAADRLGAAGTWIDWADALSTTLADLLHGFGEKDDAAGDEGVRAARSALEEIRSLQDAGVSFRAGEALSRFERALGETEILVAPGSSGVRVLDANRARGLAFDAVFLAGFNADLIPRRAPEDPFLDDTDRLALREALGAPLHTAADAREEEHLLLAHLLGSARKRVVISWQRADDAGKAKVASLALREVARLTLGEPTVDAAQGIALRVPAHPADGSRDAAERLGFLPARAAQVGAALSLRSPGRLLELAADLERIDPAEDSSRGEALTSGLTMLAAVESFAPGNLSWDAVVGDAAPPPADWSPSRLETLGACPQQYFFRHVLHVGEMEEIAEPEEIDAREMGLVVHEILKDVYGALAESGDLLGGDRSPASNRAFSLAADAWVEHTTALAARMHPRYPLLWNGISERWKNALRTFVEYDAGRLAREQPTRLDLEKEIRGSLVLDDGSVLPVHGRLDRIATTREAVIVSDYKTGSALEKHVSLAGALKGTRLQLALYALMVSDLLASGEAPAAEVRAEILGVGPAFAAGEVEDRASLDMKKLETCRRGLLETLRVLAALAGAGAFPLNASSDRCDDCPYARACRRLHAPTVARLEAERSLEAFHLLRRKSTRAVLLDDARQAAARSPEGRDGEDAP